MKKKLAIACCTLLAIVMTLEASAQTKILQGGSPGNDASRYLLEPFDVMVVTFVASAFYFLFFKKNSER